MKKLRFLLTALVLVSALTSASAIGTTGWTNSDEPVGGTEPTAWQQVQQWWLDHKPSWF